METSITELPGATVAFDNGYTLNNYEGTRRSATYTRDKLMLSAYYGEEIKYYLTGYYKKAKIEIGPFSMPNKNFYCFEHTILECIPGDKLC